MPVLGPLVIGVAGSETPSGGISDGVVEAALEGFELVRAVGGAVEGLGGLAKSLVFVVVVSDIILGAVAEIVVAVGAQIDRKGVSDMVAWGLVGDGIDLVSESV